MTVKMLTAWNGYPKDFIGSVISPAEEARLVNIKFASFDLDGQDNDNVSYPVTSKTDPLTGGLEISASGVPFAANGMIDIRMHGAKCDGVAVYDATATNSATSTIGTATASFTAADIGKRCAIVPYVDSGLTTRYGTITGVASAGVCTASLNGAPGTLTGAMFVYGSDDAGPVQAALNAAKTSGLGAVFIPGGITLASLAITIPCGVTLSGVANYATGGRAKDIRYSGSSLVLAGFVASGFIIGGDLSSGNPKGVSMTRLNIDCLDLATHAYIGTDTGRTEHINNCTIVRGITTTIKSSPTSRISQCCIFNQHKGNVVELFGDSTFTGNIVTGAGNGFYSVKLSNADDICISNNHIWKDAAQPSMLGGSIFVSINGGSVLSGGVTIIGNKFDTAYGPHIYIKASGASAGRGLNIIGNQSMNNDAVVNGTGPFIAMEIQAGCVLRGLNIHGNIVRGSWNDPSKGQHTYFLDGTLTAGSVYASSVSGNIIDNVTAGGLLNFTPGYSAGNFFLAGVGTVATAF